MILPEQMIILNTHTHTQTKKKFHSDRVLLTSDVVVLVSFLHLFSLIMKVMPGPWSRLGLMTIYFPSELVNKN